MRPARCCRSGRRSRRIWRRREVDLDRAGRPAARACATTWSSAAGSPHARGGHRGGGRRPERRCTAGPSGVEFGGGASSAVSAMSKRPPAYRTRSGRSRRGTADRRRARRRWRRASLGCGARPCADRFGQQSVRTARRRPALPAQPQDQPAEGDDPQPARGEFGVDAGRSRRGAGCGAGRRSRW